MKQYSSKERVILAYNGRHADRVPTDIQGLNIGHLPRDKSLQELATGSKKAAAGIIKAWEFVQQDIVTVGALSLPMAQAAGNECDIDENGTLYSKKCILETKANLVKMSIPDPRQDAPLPFLLEICERVGSELGNEAAVRGVVSLPWTVAMQMRGLERLIYDTADDPGFIHSVMRFCTDYTKGLGDAVIKAIGEGAVGLYATDPSSGCSVISPRVYREFVKPYQEEVVNHFKEKGIPVTFHICGYIEPIIKDLISTGVDGVSIDEKTSLERMFEISQGKTLVLGNISPLLFANGSKEEMETAVKECLEIAGGESKYILASGCAIPPGTPLENIQSFIKAAGEYGRYDDSKLSQSES
ncbi:MAG: uroporphyrinogen decarboxylase family protein [Deltaproteobacteria bacterium]|nr:uroporphyrinogen decarboxylase family protein [Deltaproteobacteria bacterium]